MQTLPTPDSIKVYSKLGLAFYDSLIVGWLAPRVWGCAPSRLVEHYRDHVTNNHADIGVGTGYCLDRCGFESPPRLALIDLQPNCLEHAARRLRRFRPHCYWRDVQQPVRGVEGPSFSSIALCGVLHCLPGDLKQKARVFDNLAPLTNGGTRIFGSTLVSDDIPRRLRRRFFHRLLNRTRVVQNTGDRLADLQAALATRYLCPRIELAGCMALFSAVVPHNPRSPA